MPQSRSSTIILFFCLFNGFIVAPITLALWQQTQLHNVTQPVWHKIPAASFLTPQLDVITPLSDKLPLIRHGEISVPPLYFRHLPRFLVTTTHAPQRKRVFIAALLPSILYVNQTIQAEKKNIDALHRRYKAGQSLTDTQKAWLHRTFKRYKVSPGKWNELKTRVDTIPPSLALAQAAIESGWGTSRFAQQGNALYGQWTWSGQGMVPKARAEGKRHRIKTFDNLIGSVHSYTLNLNTHPAYRNFRNVRAKLRRDNAPLTANKELTKTLHGYSELGHSYVRTLNNIIRVNRLKDFDKAPLSTQMADHRQKQDLS